MNKKNIATDRFRLYHYWFKIIYEEILDETEIRRRDEPSVYKLLKNDFESFKKNLKSIRDNKQLESYLVAFLIFVNNFKNERRVLQKYQTLKPYYYWLKDLFKWIFVFNLFVGLFNLLPLGIVDGGRILKTLLDRIMKNKKKAQKVWGFISFFFLAVLILGLLTTYFGNPFALFQ